MEKIEHLARIEENQNKLDDSLTQIFENAPKIEAMIKNQKSHEGQLLKLLSDWHVYLRIKKEGRSPWNT